MSYATGVPTSPVNLLQTFATWLVSIGWTSDKSAAAGLGWESHLHKNGVYVHFRAAVGERTWSSTNENDALGTALSLFLSTSFSGSGAWDAQPGNPPVGSATSNVVGCGMNLSAGPFSNYYFFADTAGDNVALVLEKTPGLFEYLFWGISLAKVGSWTGGMYFGASSSGYYASSRSNPLNTPGSTETSPCPGSLNDANASPAAFVLCNSDSFTGKWIAISDNAGANLGFTGRTGTSSVVASDGIRGGTTPSSSIPRYAIGPDTLGADPHQFQYQQTSQLDGRVNLLPVLWWVGRDGSSGSTGPFSLIGSLPMIFFSNGVGNGFVPAGEYALGASTYKMFPNFAVLKV
jgi:hypothetical protein